MQSPELIVFEGEELHMPTTPLCDWLRDNGIEIRAERTSTSLYRQYIGTWEISENKLFLTKVETWGTTPPVDLHALFPGQGNQVFASWYTGRLAINRGKRLLFDMVMYESIHEQQILIDIEDGHVTHVERRKNGTANDRPMVRTVADLFRRH
jgi:hypothetical protein